MKEIKNKLVEELTADLICAAARKYGISIVASMSMIFNSDLFAQLIDETTGRYQEGIVALLYDLDSEITCGRLPQEY